MDKYERYDEIIKGLDQVIHHLTLLGRFWTLKGALFLDWIRNYYGLAGEKKLLSARSSLYYSARNNALARAFQNKLLMPYWLIVCFFCSLLAVRFSDRFAKIGLKNMNVGELDVRATILRNATIFHKPERRTEALKCINEALSQQEIAAHSKVLLIIGKADIFAAQNKIDEAMDIYKEALRYAQSSLVLSSDPCTHVRLNKSYARFLIKYKPEVMDPSAKKMLKEAKEIAIREGLIDQVKKIVALQIKAYK